MAKGWAAHRTLRTLLLGCAACSEPMKGWDANEEPAAISHVPAVPAAASAGAVDGSCATPECGVAPLAQRFVIIGDYGDSAGGNEAKVAALVARLKPDFVITTGDNNYLYGEAATIDENIGRYFHAFIAPYRGQFGSGAKENRFFPSLGNHDFNISAGYQPYLDYFSLPNNERYYQIVRGNVQLFALNSDLNEPDGTTIDSKQAHWLEALLGASEVPWRLVYFHHPPYTSGPHGGTVGMRWPFAEWGASIVYSGHDHTYERLAVDGFPYIINGVGGKQLYEITEPVPESLVRHADVHGLVLVTATPTEFVSRFLDARGQVLEVFRLHKE
ncbi:MAG TPA: metallophosphoesterase [Polyangiaceae bacterium]|nr:metallophosphoesterase [Polyangiaceae bacterium]